MRWRNVKCLLRQQQQYRGEIGETGWEITGESTMVMALSSPMRAVADTASISSAEGAIVAVDLAALAIEGAVMTTVTTAFVVAAVTVAESAAAIVDPTVAIESRAEGIGMGRDRARRFVPRVTTMTDRARASGG